MRTYRWTALFLLSLIFCGTATTVCAETGSAAATTVQLPDASHSDGLSLDPQLPDQKAPKSAADIRAEHDQEKARQKQRWEDIKRRSEQLLEVATELKQYVDKSGENVMSLEVIKKAAEMEKLSKDLQRKMKGD